MGKSHKVTGAEIISAPKLPEKEMPASGNVWIVLFSDGKDHLVSTQLAKTLIDKQSAKLK